MKRFSQPLHEEYLPVPRPQARAPHAGFTLVEMLVVITIIGILAGMVTAAAIVARTFTRNATIVNEVKQLEMACQVYKEKFGEYPPDFCGVDGSLDTDTTNWPIRTAVRNLVLRHLARAFPRYVPGSWDNLRNTILSSWGVDIHNYGPQGALTFWLGGRPTWSGATIGTGNVIGFTGFSANPLNPFDASSSRINPFFDLDPIRIYRTTNTVLLYYPATTTNRNENNPLVYFRAENGNYTYNGLAVAAITGESIKRWGNSETSIVIPAIDIRLSNLATYNYVWMNPRLFQIFCAGLDETYASPDGYDSATPPAHSAPTEIRPLLFPTGDNYAPETYDDITNFSGGKLEDAIP